MADQDPCGGCGHIHPENVPCPDGTTWYTGRVMCAICGHTHVAVWPSTAGDVQECPACGHVGKIFVVDDKDGHAPA